MKGLQLLITEHHREGDKHTLSGEILLFGRVIESWNATIENEDDLYVYYFTDEEDNELRETIDREDELIGILDDLLYKKLKLGRYSHKYLLSRSKTYDSEGRKYAYDEMGNKITGSKKL